MSSNEVKKKFYEAMQSFDFHEYAMSVEKITRGLYSSFIRNGDNIIWEHISGQNLIWHLM